MGFGFCSFSSDSTGNSYLIKNDNTAILVDVGISGRKICEGLRENGLNIIDVQAVMLTHEHADHIKSTGVLSRMNKELTFYGTKGTYRGLKDKVEENKYKVVAAGDDFSIDDIQCRVYNLSHDAAEPCGYSFTYNQKTIAIVTDTGYVTEEIFEEILGADLLVIEANHEENILMMGAYPYTTKMRILSDKGHLSNEASGRCICNYLKKRKKNTQPTVVLAHLSKNNNTPGQAYLTIRNILEEENLYINKDLALTIVTKDEVSPFMEV